MSDKETKAQKVFNIVRDSTYASCGNFSWKEFHDVARQVMNPGSFSREAFKATVGKMLRAQCKHGTIIRVSRGHYRFVEHDARAPFYVTAGEYRHHGLMTELFFKGRRRSYWLP